MSAIDDRASRAAIWGVPRRLWVLGACAWFAVWFIGLGLAVLSTPACAAAVDIWVFRVRGESLGAAGVVGAVCFVGAMLASAAVMAVGKYGRGRVVIPLVLASGWSAASWFLPAAIANFIISEQIDPQCDTSMNSLFGSYVVVGLLIAAASPLILGVLVIVDHVRNRRISAARR